MPVTPSTNSSVQVSAHEAVNYPDQVAAKLPFQEPFHWVPLCMPARSIEKPLFLCCLGVLLWARACWERLPESCAGVHWLSAGWGGRCLEHFRSKVLLPWHHVCNCNCMQDSKGFLVKRDGRGPTEFLYPEAWLADQQLFNRYARRIEQQNPLDPPPLSRYHPRCFPCSFHLCTSFPTTANSAAATPHSALRCLKHCEELHISFVFSDSCRLQQ